MNQMGAYKAPGPDGFSPCIFQKYWHILGEEIFIAVQGMFVTGKLVEGLNHALICLIPKGESPELLSHFRPISLCNVMVKVASTILANRLKPLMIRLTSQNQSSFIPGRSTVDKIIVAQELVHLLTKRKGTQCGFVLKVDLEKAYDRVDGPTLERSCKSRA